MGIVTRLEDGWGSDSGGDKGDISLLRNTWVPTHLQWAPEFCPVLKRTVLDFYHPRLSSAEVKNNLKYISPPSVCAFL